MSAVMKKRLGRALFSLVIVVMAGAALTVPEVWARQKDCVQLPPQLSAQTMTEAVLEGSVGEMVSSFGGTSIEAPSADLLGAADGMPSWLAEVMTSLETPDQVLVGQGGALVSLYWCAEAGQSDHLAELLEMAGWHRVDSGLNGCFSYTREKGEGEWLMVTEWSGANGTVVVARCV